MLFEHKYWKVAFDLFFHHSFLEAMFGPEAVQHAPKDSYPEYFRKVIELDWKKKTCPEIISFIIYFWDIISIRNPSSLLSLRTDSEVSL